MLQSARTTTNEVVKAQELVQMMLLNTRTRAKEVKKHLNNDN
jgi:hypothetical protein